MEESRECCVGEGEGGGGKRRRVPKRMEERGGGVAEGEESRRGRSRGGGGVAGREGSRKGWATPAATRLRFKTESRGVPPPFSPATPPSPAHNAEMSHFNLGTV